MKLLSLDLGLTTGYCVMQDAIALEIGELEHTSLRGGLQGVYLRFGPFERVIAERTFPYKNSRLGKQLRKVHADVMAEFGFDEIHWIVAGDWKSTSFGKMAAPRGLSAHEKDAYRIALFADARHLAERETA